MCISTEKYVQSPNFDHFFLPSPHHTMTNQAADNTTPHAATKVDSSISPANHGTKKK
jgi:hypothetical protein